MSRELEVRGKGRPQRSQLAEGLFMVNIVAILDILSSETETWVSRHNNDRTFAQLAPASIKDHMIVSTRKRPPALSLKFLELGTKVQRQCNIARIARPYIEKLMKDTRENANLCALAGDDVIYLDHVHSDEHMLQCFTSLGTRVPLYATSVGKALLSQRRESEIKAYLKRIKPISFTEKTCVTKAKLVDELRKVKDKGYALDNEEREAGIRCIGAPIYDHRGQCNAAISVSGPTLRLTDSRIEELGKTVKKYALQISERIGYRLTGKKDSLSSLRYHS